MDGTSLSTELILNQILPPENYHRLPFPLEKLLSN